MSDRKIFRCAIYTRVSTDHGLEQEFNSLAAQREACEAYIKSQSGEGWRLLSNDYDDGGYSGGSVDRPALQRLLHDIEQAKLDMVVVYKVDRLTRSLADFAKLVERFDKQGITFVSITQSFNTTTSMGRLTLNVLLSFAQFEREVTGERIRDKIAASKKKGMRVGGPVPLGYVVRDKKLVGEPAEAEAVRHIFSAYLDKGSLASLVLHLNGQGIRTKRNIRRDGTIRGEVAFRKGSIAFLLRNRTYIGDIVHKGTYYKGEHEPIVPLDLFNAVQDRLTEQAQNEGGTRVNTASPLIGLLYDERGNRMTPATTNKQGMRYRYYVSSAPVTGRQGEAGSVSRVSAAEIEAAVKDAILERSGKPDINDESGQAEDTMAIFARLRRVTVRTGALEIALHTDSGHEIAPMVIPWSPTLFRRRRELIAVKGECSHRPIRAETRARLVEGIAMARLWLDEIVSGKVTGTHEIATREKLSERSVRMKLNLAFLSPAITKAAIEGTLPHGLGICRLMDQEMDWSRQGGM